MGVAVQTAADKILSGLTRLKNCSAVPADYLQFRTGLWLAQMQAFARISSSGHPGALPIVSSDVQFNPVILEKLLQDFMGLLRESGSGSPEMERVGSTPEIRAAFPEIARSVVFDSDSPLLHDVARRLSLGTDALFWLGRVLAAPFVTAAVRRIQERASIADKASTTCPFCRSAPGLAFLRRQDGRRVLACSLCGECWSAARIECPFCRNTQQIVRLDSDQDEARWIEACAGCKCYIKTVDERRLPDTEQLIPLAESVRTLYLDLVAEKQNLWTGTLYASLC